MAGEAGRDYDISMDITMGFGGPFCSANELLTLGVEGICFFFCSRTPDGAKLDIIYFVNCDADYLM